MGSRNSLWSRVAVIVTASMALSTGMPPGLVDADGDFPLSGLADLLTTRPSWAIPDPKIPKQQRGRTPDGHYAASEPVAYQGARAPKAPGELAPYTPYRPTVKTRTAGSVKEGFARRTSKRVARLSDAHTDVFDNADGTVTRRISKNPVNFKAADGTWKPIDSTLRRGSDGRPKATAGAVDLSFAAGSTVSKTPDDLVRVGVEPGVEVAWSLAGAALGRAELSGGTATYEQAMPGVDVQVGAQSVGVKENLILHSADVPTEYVYPLRLKGVTPRISADGEIEFVTADGEVALVMPRGYLEDSAIGASGAGAVSHEVRYELIETGGGTAVRMSIDGAWLRDPARRFPILLDPQARVVTNGETFTANVDTVSNASANNVAVGTWNAGGEKFRSFLDFDNFPTTMQGKKLDSAKLHLFQTYQSNGTGCVARPYNVYPITGTWNAATTVWSNMPAYDTGRLMTTASTTSTAACNNTGAVRNTGTWSSSTLNQEHMVTWASTGGITGLAITASETDSLAFKRFTATEANVNCSHPTFGTIRCDPFIEINYSANTAPQVDARYPANNTTVSTLTPEISAQGSDPDNYPGRGLRFNFFLYDDKGAQIAQSGWTGGFWRPAAGLLSWGRTYLLAVQANDWSSSGPAEPVISAFSTTVPQPMISASLAQNSGKGFEPSVGNYTTDATDAQVATAGPALSVDRDYNSLDTRAGSAYGLGWSSLPDMRVRENRDPDNVLQTATIRYPDGQEVSFGRNNDGTWVPPSGRYSVFRTITGGYSLTDKDSTSYEFTRAVSTGAYGLTKITDGNGRSLTVRYDASGRADQFKSLSSNRTLTLTWVTPAGATAPHVATVTTDPAVPGDPSTAMMWTYSYDGDLLTKVCPPGTTSDCARYEYKPVNQHASTVLNTNPFSFWRLNEAAGQTQAKSGVLSNDGTDNGLYTDVTLGGAGPLPESTSTSASFNGTSSRVKLPAKLAWLTSYQTVSLWFRTTTPHGVLLSNQKGEIAPGATASGGYNPVLYVDNTGRLRGQFWNGCPACAVATTDPVTDGRWHHVALSGNGGTQQMYLDGQPVGAPVVRGIVLPGTGQDSVYLGGGFIGGSWPAHNNTAAATATFFKGDIADVAFHNRPLNATEVTLLKSSGVQPASAVSKVVSDAGRVRAQIAHDTLTGRVSRVTDENGGDWTIGVPTVSGSSQVYASTVLGSRPRDYFRLNDISGPENPVGEVAGNEAWYRDVVFDTTQPGTSPFADQFGAGFNGTSSHVDVQNSWNEAETVEMWFKTPAGHATSGALLGTQNNSIAEPYVSDGVGYPTLYIGTDGLLRGTRHKNPANALTSTVKVNDGNWHHVALVSRYNTDRQFTLYLDGAKVGTRVMELDSLWNRTQIGAAYTAGWPGSSGNVSWFKGHIAEYAHYDRLLSDADIDAHMRASKSATPPPAGVTGPVLTPVTTVSVTDPGGKASSRMFDLLNGNRLIADTDVLGNTTSYAYDTGGFVSAVYDPVGQRNETGKDVRGNTVRTTSCDNWNRGAEDDELLCQSTFYSFWPDSTTVQLTPNPKNDQITDVRDGRSASATDNTYRTHFEYDTAGNRISMTTPPVAGFPVGRTTTLTYTTATTAALGGGVTPAGLPRTTRTPGGAQQQTEYTASGDVAQLTDPAGLVTRFGYDALGRVVRKTVVWNTEADARVTTYRYDAQGQLVESTEPTVTNAVTGAQHTARTTDSYDADGNLTGRTIADLHGGDSARTVRTDYDGHGRPIRTVDEAGVVSLFSYDVYGRQTKAVICDSTPDAGDECPGGDVLRVSESVFDAEGQLLESYLTGADGARTRLTYNVYYGNGALASETNAEGHTTRYTYYPNGKLELTNHPQESSGYTAEWNFYDGAGNLIERRGNDTALVNQYSYDQAGRLTSEVSKYSMEQELIDCASRQCPGENVSASYYLHDADDRVVTTRHTERGHGKFRVLETVHNSYDAMGRPVSETIHTDATSRPNGWWKFSGTQAMFDGTLRIDDDSGAGRELTGPSGDSYITLNGDTATFQKDFNVAVLHTDDWKQGAVETDKSYTVSAWVNLKSLGSTQSFVAQIGDTEAAFKLQYSQAVNKWRFVVAGSDSTSPQYYTATAGAAPTTNTWVHLVAVHNAESRTATVYANNVAGTTATGVTTFNGNKRISLGAARYGDTNAYANRETMDGQLDNVQVYQRALSPADVATLYRSGGGRTADVTAETPGVTSTAIVNKLGLTTATVDFNGNRTDYRYDEADRLVEAQDPAVSAETFGSTPVTVRPRTLTGYNTFGEAVEQQDPLGNVIQTRVDALGRPVRTIMPGYTPPGGTPIADASSTVVYDKLGQVVASTDPLGATTTYEYDSLGGRTKVTDPAGNVSTARYDGVGNLIESVDPTGAKSTATYDFLGRLETSTQIVRQPSPEALTTTYDYTDPGDDIPADRGPWAKSVTTPDGVTTHLRHTVKGEQRTIRDGAGNVTTTAYDGLGRPTTVTGPDGTKQVSTYDGAGRLTRTQELAANGTVLRTRSASYDNNGNMTKVVDGRGTTTTVTYDALGRITDQHQPLTASTAMTTSFGYDAAGHSTRFTDGRTNAFWSTYNSWGQLESQIEPATAAFPNPADRTWTTAYDRAGRAVSQSQPGGVRVDLGYDGLGRLTERTGTGAEVATPTLTFDYDDAGRPTSMSSADHAIAVTYDDRGLPLSVNGPNDDTSYTYTKDGLVRSRTDAAGTTGFTYDGAGRTKTVENATTGIDLSIAYNELSMPATVTYEGGNRRTFQYDDMHRLTADRITTADGTKILGSIGYGYDLNDNITTKTTTGFAGAAVNTYGYDLANRLTSWSSGSTVTDYAYDASGNRTRNGAKTFTYDQRNRLLTQNIGDVRYTYTARGTLALTAGDAGTFTTLADAYGQVVSQQAAGGVTSRHSYDALGRAIRPGFEYSGLDNDLAADGTALYTRGAAGELLGVNSVYTWTDQHTDVVGQFTGAGITLAGSTAYDPLGAVLAGTGMAGNLGYQSEWSDDATGRVNMLARWYNTDTGQFDTRDTANNSPLPSSISANRYQYGDGNPLTTIDPSGHWGISLKGITNFVSKATTAVTKVVTNTYKAATSTYKYVASGQAWKDVKKAGTWVADKAKTAYNVVKTATVTWVNKKVTAVKDAYDKTKSCLKNGVGKCTVQAAKAAVKKTVTTVKQTVQAIKEDPWKFVATAVVATAAAVAVGALCATGIGCLLLAGAAAGAMAAGAGYMVDVAQGEQDFSLRDLASTMIEGALDGALSAGLSKFTGGAGKLLGGPGKGNRGGPGGGGPKAGPSARPGTQAGPSAGRPATGSSRPDSPTARSNGSPSHQRADEEPGSGRRYWGTTGGTTRSGHAYLTPRTNGLRDAVNPGGGRRNCGPVSCEVDRVLAGNAPRPVDAADRPLYRDQLEQMVGGDRQFVQVARLSGVARKMTAWGDGSRAIVAAYPNRGEGHFFNVINDGGRVVFLDGQTGIASHVDVWRHFFLMRTDR